MTTDIAEADSTDLTLADQVRARLERDGLRPEAASEAIGIPTARLISLLQGGTPSFSTQRRIEVWLGSRPVADLPDLPAETAPPAAPRTPFASTQPIGSTLPEFARLEISKLKPNPNNPRRIDDKHPSLVGLADSVREHDVLEPLLVRHLEDGSFEILAGERRWRAARIAGLGKVPCLVRVCDDQTAFSITVVENLQREDLHWLEEARGVAAMIAKGWDAEAIAKQIGKSPAWVHLRAKLATISPKWIKEVEDTKGSASRWPIAMVEEIARFPISTQDALLDEPYKWQIGRAETTAELREILDREFLRLLKSASFPIEDAQLLPKAGACTACPKRSSCQQLLFADAKADTCLDASCWDQKAERHRDRAIEELKKKAPKAVIAAKDQEAAINLDENVIPACRFEIAKEGEKGAKPAIILAEGKAPRLGFIKSPSPGGAQATAAGGDLSPKEKLAQFLKRRDRAAIEAVIIKLGGPADSNSINHFGDLKKASADVTRPPRHALIALAVAFRLRQETYGSDDRWRDYARFKEMTDEAQDLCLWDALRIEIVSNLIADKQQGETSGAGKVAAITGLNWRAITESARDTNPLPKTLAVLFEEDGTPRKGVGKPEKRRTVTKETASGSVRMLAAQPDPKDGTDPDLDYPRLLKVAITTHGLSLQMAAKAIGISVPSLRSVIAKTAAPNVRTRIKLDRWLRESAGKASKAGG